MHSDTIGEAIELFINFLLGILFGTVFLLLLGLAWQQEYGQPLCPEGMALVAEGFCSP